jgi:hypothetical protein
MMPDPALKLLLSVAGCYAIMPRSVGKPYNVMPIK